jgi:hypothetical protein
MEGFSPTEQQHLAPFFTNLTESIFGLKLPQEVAGALFSRYSRSSKSLRRIFLDEFLSKADFLLVKRQEVRLQQQNRVTRYEKACEFYDRVLIGYGDDSVAIRWRSCRMSRSQTWQRSPEDARIGIALENRRATYASISKDQTEIFFSPKNPGSWRPPITTTICL